MGVPFTFARAQAGRASVPVRYWRPTLLVLLPFAVGYFLSYLFRTINALISASLTEELGLDASSLGLITSVYFLTFAAAQLPLGVMLDRFGVRRVQSGLLLVAVAGALLFATADSLVALVAGRALIGIGVAGALIGGLKAIAFAFPKERLPLVNGCYIMLGALGAVTATAPAEWLQEAIGWRGLFELLAAVTAAVALLIFTVVVDPSPTTAAPAPYAISLKTIYGDARFWRLAPLSMLCISTAWALQGLWAAPWLADVEILPRSSIVRHLLVMAIALSAGALLLGIIADRLRRRGIGPGAVLGVTACLFVAAELSLILGLPVAPASQAAYASYAAWAVIAGVGAATVLSYSILGDCFPKEIAGQANAALNLLHIGGAFVLQEAIGLIVNRWPSLGGHYPPLAYKTAFALIVLLQIGGIIWFVPALRMAREPQSQPAE
jgi:MFS family permease